MWVLATLGLLAMTAVAVWFGLAASLTKPTWQTVGFAAADGEQGIVLKFLVRRPEGMAVRCQVIAKERSHAIVGTAEVTIPPEWGVEVVTTQLIRTTSPAVAAEVRNCREI